jgi:hypothetical protein
VAIRFATPARWISWPPQRWLGLNAPRAGGWLEHTLEAVGLPLPAQYIQCESFAFRFELMARIDALMAVPARFLQSPLNRPQQWVEVALDRTLPALELGLCTRADPRPRPLAAAFSRTVVYLARQPERPVSMGRASRPPGSNPPYDEPL